MHLPAACGSACVRGRPGLRGRASRGPPAPASSAVAAVPSRPGGRVGPQGREHTPPLRPLGTIHQKRSPPTTANGDLHQAAKSPGVRGIPQRQQMASRSEAPPPDVRPSPSAYCTHVLYDLRPVRRRQYATPYCTTVPPNRRPQNSATKRPPHRITTDRDPAAEPSPWPSCLLLLLSAVTAAARPGGPRTPRARR